MAWILVITSLALQLAAAGMAIRLIRVTGRRWAWGLIATAILLMVVRRIVALNMLRLELANPTRPVPPSLAPASLRGMPVLIVDDNATKRQILAEITRSWGMVPTAVRGADKAFAVLGQASSAGVPYPLVLIDAHMPCVDGFLLVERMKQERSWGSPVVSMLTSGDHPEDAQCCRQLGIAGYLLKPVKQSELLEAGQAATSQVFDLVLMEQCIVRSVDDISMALRWSGRSAREVAGQAVRLRLHVAPLTGTACPELM